MGGVPLVAIPIIMTGCLLNTGYWASPNPTSKTPNWDLRIYRLRKLVQVKVILEV